MILPRDFDLAWALKFLGARSVAGLEVVGPASYQRVVSLAGRHYWVTVAFAESAVSIRSNPPLPPATRRRIAARLFDLDLDLTPFRRLASRDPILKPLVRRRPGLRRPLLIDPFEAAVRAIVGQLVSVAAATTVVGRLVHRFGPAAGGGARAFPGPEELVGAGRRALAAVGLTAEKGATLLRLSEACLSGALDWDGLRHDAERAEESLRAIRGIGPWTSAYVRWRGLGDPDAFPTTDLGIVAALAARGVVRGEVAARAERWRPWRGLVVGHLWASLAEEQS